MGAARRGMLPKPPPPEEVERRHAALPPWLASALLPFQHEGVRFGLERGGRVLLADEMVLLPSSAMIRLGGDGPRPAALFAASRWTLQGCRSAFMTCQPPVRCLQGVGKSLQAIALASCYQVRPSSSNSASLSPEFYSRRSFTAVC